jgi:uncharacterized membrane protein
MDALLPSKAVKPKRPMRPFRAAVLRGLGILVPPLLTIVIFVWIGQTIFVYVLTPVTGAAREGLVWATASIRTDLPVRDRLQDSYTAPDGIVYQRIEDDTFIPYAVYDLVRRSQVRPMPRTAVEYYRSYVDLVWLRPFYVIPLFLLVFVFVLYLLGKFLAAGIGRAFWTTVEHTITRLPLVRTVYSAVKQFTDFFFSDTEVQFTRVIAVEYPRRGIWSLAFVVSESFLDISAAANDEVIAVYVPTSPMPMAGFTITVPKREVIDLNITIDQAIQFIFSCGVVAPPYEVQRELQKLRSEGPAVSAATSGNG